MSDPRLRAILQNRRSQPAQLIEVLQDIQKEYRYVSEPNMRAVARELGVPLIEVFGVASYYNAFRLQPGGKIALTLCIGAACHARSSRLLLDQAMRQLGIAAGEVTSDGLFSLDLVNCLGVCAVGPIVKENEIYHPHMTPGKLRRLIETIRNREMEEIRDAKT